MYYLQSFSRQIGKEIFLLYNLNFLRITNFILTFNSGPCFKWWWTYPRCGLPVVFQNRHSEGMLTSVKAKDLHMYMLNNIDHHLMNEEGFVCLILTFGGEALFSLWLWQTTPSLICIISSHHTQPCPVIFSLLIINFSKRQGTKRFSNKKMNLFSSYRLGCIPVRNIVLLIFNKYNLY